VGGEVRGNYPTWNPLDGRGSQTTYADGNLEATVSGNPAQAFTTMATPTTGKWYCEFTVGGVAQFGGDWMIGISDATKSLAERNWTGASGWYLYAEGTKYNNGSGVGGWSVSYTSGDVIGVAVDLDVGTLSFYKNGTNLGVAYNTGIAGKSMLFGLGTGTGSLTQYQAARINCGQRPFAYTAPAGHKALCTTNLPTTIGATAATQAGKFFNAATYTGTTANQSVAVGFKPDWVWIKSRSNVTNHFMYDVVRGVNIGIISNSTGSEASYGMLPSFDTNGFTASSNGNQYDGTNYNTYTYVAWNWKAGSSTVTNTAGSVNSQVSANPTAGFSVVTYTGPGGTSGTIGHGLGATPSMIIVKNRDGITANWTVYHASLGNTKALYLNTTDAEQTATSFWNNTSPSSTVFTVGNNAGTNYSVTINYVAYCFAPIAGYSDFGSYIGNGSANGPFVYTGFKPAFLLIRTTGTAAGYQWFMFDNKRDSYNLTQNPLTAHTSGAEPASASGYRELDMLSNGFKIRASGDQINYSTQQYIYMAFAENPFKYALAR
jgi:hypothetical protein